MWRHGMAVLCATLAIALAGCGSGEQVKETAGPVSLPTSGTVTLLTAASPTVATPTPQPTEVPSPTPAPTAEPTSTTVPAAAPVSPTETAPPQPAATPIETTATPAPAPTEPPLVLSGGEWDFEAGFTIWANPFGEPCGGGALGGGWSAFLTAGQFGSSCLNENKYAPNVQSGERSQEITFESIDGVAGLWRSFPTTPGRRYRVSAWGIWHESPSPVILELGVDAGGGQDRAAGSVTWSAWADPSPGAWHAHSLEFTAAAGSATVFLRGAHPVAQTTDPSPLRGGATLFDNVEVTELGR